MTERTPEERAAFRTEVLERQRAKAAAMSSGIDARSGDNRSPDLGDVATFNRLGEALWGPRWVSSAAECLGVTERTARRWSTGEVGSPSAQDMEWLRREARLRIAQLQAILDEEIVPSAVRHYVMDGQRSGGGRV